MSSNHRFTFRNDTHIVHLTTLSKAMKNSKDIVDLGKYLHDLRIDRQLPLRTVADKLGIDVSMLSKIEHGERQLQSHMIEPIAAIYDIEYKSIQIQFINQKILHEFGDEPFLSEALQILATNRI